MENKISKRGKYKRLKKREHDNFVHPRFKISGSASADWNISKFWNEFLFFDIFAVNFRTIFKFNVSTKLYLYVCLRINGIKGIFVESFNYSSSQQMKLNQIVKTHEL